MNRNRTWRCPHCGETNECTDDACDCQLLAEDLERERRLDVEIGGKIISGRGFTLE